MRLTEVALTDIERILYDQADRLKGSLDPHSLDNWNPEFLRAILPPAEFLLQHYFRTTVTGLENIPDGPVILAGIHSGKVMSVDVSAMYIAFYRYFDLQRPLYAMAHRLLFYAPGLNWLVAAGGGVEGNYENALRVLRAGHAFAVFPGGEFDASRTWRERNRVNFARRTGFVRVALDADVPIVPVGAVGGHNTMLVISNGAWLARLLQLRSIMGLRHLPISLTVPWGLTVGYGPYLPLPARISIHFGEPLFFRPTPRERKDPHYHAFMRDAVEGEVQAIVDRLAREK